MADHFNNITQSFILSENRKERYLRLWEPGGQPLARAGIRTAGVAELVPPYDISRTHAPFHVVIYTFSGSGGSAQRTAVPGKLFVVPAGTQHYGSDSDWEMIWFHIQVGTYAVLDALTEPTRLEFRHGAVLRDLMSALCDEQELGLPSSIRAMEHYSELILIHLNRNLEVKTDPLEIYNISQLKGLWDRVQASPAHPWRVDDLARHFGLSPVQFYRTVVKYEGVPPMAKVQEIRLSQVADMLIHSNLKLEALAGMVGFQSPFSLSRAFKARYGLSPRHFKARYLSELPSEES